MRVLIALLSVLLLSTACTKRIDTSDLTGEYLGQTPPGDEPELFAPGIVSNGMRNRDIAITPDGNEIYTAMAVGGFTYSKIIYYKQVDGRWIGPELVSFSSPLAYKDIEPFISYDGTKFFFVSSRPDSANGKTDGNFDIWVSERNNNSWGEPYRLSETVNSSGNEYFPSVTKEGTIYFTRKMANTPEEFIFRSKFVDGKFQKAERLPANVNCGQARYNAMISYDEDYIIVPAWGMPDGYGGTDYYVVFRNDNDEWSNPINMGDKINTASTQEWSTYVTRDGKYFFFMSQRLGNVDDYEPLNYNKFMKLYNSPENGEADSYWMKADLIMKLKPDNF